MKYNIIYFSPARCGMVFYSDINNCMAKSAIDDGAANFDTLSDAAEKVREMIKGGISANSIGIVNLNPFDITVQC